MSVLKDELPHRYHFDVFIALTDIQAFFVHFISIHYTINYSNWFKYLFFFHILFRLHSTKGFKSTWWVYLDQSKEKICLRIIQYFVRYKNIWSITVNWLLDLKHFSFAIEILKFLDLDSSITFTKKGKERRFQSINDRRDQSNSKTIC